MLQPNIGWILPSGEFIDVANQGYTHEAFAADYLGEFAEGYSDESAALELVSQGWVRYTGGNVEGMQRAIAKHWSVIRRLVEEDLANNAYTIDDGAAFDVYIGDVDKRRSFNVPISQMLKTQPPAGVFGKPSRVQQFRRRPRPIRPLRQPKVAVRRHLRHPPGMCLCHRSKTVNRVRRKMVRRLK